MQLMYIYPRVFFYSSLLVLSTISASQSVGTPLNLAYYCNLSKSYTCEGFLLAVCILVNNHNSLVDVLQGKKWVYSHLETCLPIRTVVLS